jgi:hypothetical protein
MSQARKKYSPSLSPSDIRRLEEAFLDTPAKPKPTPSKISKMLPWLFIVLIGISVFCYFKYSVLFLPKLKPEKQSLLNNQLLDSIALISKDSKIQFSQGIIYLPLFPQKPQGFILTVKKPLDLTRNDILVEYTNIEKNSKKNNIVMRAIIRDTKFFSNALTPLERKLNLASVTQEQGNTIDLELSFENDAGPYLNLARVKQIRFEFHNLKNVPISLLVKDVRLVKKEGK